MFSIGFAFLHLFPSSLSSSSSSSSASLSLFLFPSPSPSHSRCCMKGKRGKKKETRSKATNDFPFDFHVSFFPFSFIRLCYCRRLHRKKKYIFTAFAFLLPLFHRWLHQWLNQSHPKYRHFFMTEFIKRILTIKISFIKKISKNSHDEFQIINSHHKLQIPSFSLFLVINCSG